MALYCKGCAAPAEIRPGEPKRCAMCGGRSFTSFAATPDRLATRPGEPGTWLDFYKEVAASPDRPRHPWSLSLSDLSLLKSLRISPD